MAQSHLSNKDELPLGRLEAFSDGVFAIAIRLLMLERAVTVIEGESLTQALIEQWPVRRRGL